MRGGGWPKVGPEHALLSSRELHSSSAESTRRSLMAVERASVLESHSHPLPTHPHRACCEVCRDTEPSRATAFRGGLGAPEMGLVSGCVATRGRYRTRSKAGSTPPPSKRQLVLSRLEDSKLFIIVMQSTGTIQLVFSSMPSSQGGSLAQASATPDIRERALGAILRHFCFGRPP